MYLITGVSGALGRATLEYLLLRVPKSEIVATARNLGSIQAVSAMGIETRRAD